MGTVNKAKALEPSATLREGSLAALEVTQYRAHCRVELGALIGAAAAHQKQVTNNGRRRRN